MRELQHFLLDRPPVRTHFYGMNDPSQTCSIDAGQPHADDTSPFDPGEGKHVLFFGDPMCSWCWGFAPELAQLHALIEGQAEFHMVMGGLRPGTRDAWDETMRRYIREHWEDVQAKTGQPFDFTRFDDRDFIYDTEPACRALVTVRAIAPQRQLAMYESLQRAFYAEGRDITDTLVLTDLAADQQIDRAQFLHFFAGAQAKEQVKYDFARTQAFGVSGFPSVLCAEDGQYGFLALGYRTFATLVPMLDEWLNA